MPGRLYFFELLCFTVPHDKISGTDDSSPTMAFSSRCSIAFRIMYFARFSRKRSLVDSAAAPPRSLRLMTMSLLPWPDDAATRRRCRATESQSRLNTRECRRGRARRPTAAATMSDFRPLTMLPFSCRADAADYAAFEPAACAPRRLRDRRRAGLYAAAMRLIGLMASGKRKAVSRSKPK